MSDEVVQRILLESAPVLTVLPRSRVRILQPVAATLAQRETMPVP